MLAYVIILIASVAAIIYLFIKVRRLEAKSVNVTASDLMVYSEILRELLAESERVAEKLDAAIRVREEALEDVGALLDARISRMKELGGENAPEELKLQVARLIREGRTKNEVARLLNMSVTEIELLSAIGRG
jgi:DNA-binding NarL/FixJ family response regulator